MLVEFSVGNFRSICDRQTLSFMASSRDEHEDSHVFRPEGFETTQLVRSAVIFGPNASGKTNILRALGTMRNLVVTSTKGDIGSYRIQPFLLDSQRASEPTEMEVVFIHNGNQYQYGFSISNERITEEWLFARPSNGRTQKWYTRNYDQTSNSYEWYINDAKLKGNKKALAESTKTNSLFLSTAAMLNHKQLGNVYEWFEEKLRVIGPFSALGNITAEYCKSSDVIDTITEFLHSADLSIENINVEFEKGADKLFTDSELPKNIQKFFREKIGDFELPNVSFQHRVRDRKDKTVTFELSEESTGTQNLFSIAMPWIETLANGYTLAIDELESSLHTHIIRHLLGMIHAPSLNESGAQLIFTTHNTSLLDKELFRRDQIWFTEKQNDATKLYSLLDFHPRRDEALERGYLQGKYGAIPIAGTDPIL